MDLAVRLSHLALHRSDVLAGHLVVGLVVEPLVVLIAVVASLGRPVAFEGNLRIVHFKIVRK